MIGSLGESLIDFTPIVEGGRTTGFRLHPGGSPYNVAIAIARLGHPSAFAGRVSVDVFGSLLAEHLRANGVDTGLLLVGPEPTTLAFVALERGEPAFSFRAEGTADTLIRPTDLRPADFADLEALHVGSISLLYDATGASIVELLRALHGRLPLSFDPNVRPSLLRDADEYRARVRELAGLVDLVKLSERDRQALGDALDPVRLTAGAVTDGPVAVIVTRGALGSRLHRRGSTLTCPAAPSRVVDTVGAGDAFTAAVLVGLAERGALARRAMVELADDEWLAVLRFASTTAALACERAGADPPRREAVQERLGAAHASTRR